MFCVKLTFNERSWREDTKYYFIRHLSGYIQQKCDINWIQINGVVADIVSRTPRVFCKWLSLI